MRTIIERERDQGKIDPHSIDHMRLRESGASKPSAWKSKLSRVVWLDRENSTFGLLRIAAYDDPTLVGMGKVDEFHHKC
jgi:hypothetical protein